MKGFRLFLSLLLLFMFAVVSAVFADEIKIGAGAAPTENVLKPVKGPFEKASGIKMTIISSGPKIAWQDLEKGTVDAAAAGLTFEDWVSLMKKEGTEVKDPAAYNQVVIGKDRISVLVHKDNPVKTLSKEQLKGIFTGKINNWKEVGGKDLAVIVVWGKLIPGTNSLFIKRMLDGEAQLKDVLEATTAEDVKNNVVSNPEAIGIGPSAIIDTSVGSPQTPEVSRPIILLTKGNPSANIQKLIDFIKGEGQKHIK
ncbi:MAG: phosphate ABC transporter substrate-binding protein [Nitrospirae bacterium]|nr:MAG: phosphate ABC transporter substrate-binding protein [Nitrospirota bacterium]